MILLKETKVYRVENEAAAQALIEKETSPEYSLDSSIKNKTKKSKGEIIDSWAEVSLTKKYDI